MKTSKIKIRTMFGVSEIQLNDKSVEIKGAKGAGKTSILDAIRYCLTNRSERDYIIKQGANEAEIFIETDTGLSIDRKERAGKAQSLEVKENGLNVQRPQSFLNDIITPLQLNPVDFIQKPIAEQNRIILDLIDFKWDMDWIQEKFGEIPKGVNYKENILTVLSQIQADNGVYYQTRQTINSEKLYKNKSIEAIAGTIPEHYSAEKWEQYDLVAKVTELEKIRAENAKIERSKAYKAAYDNELRGIQAEKDIAIAAVKQGIASEREGLLSTVERLKAEIKAATDKITHLEDKLKDKIAIAESDYNIAKTKLDSNIEKADQYADKIPASTVDLQAEIQEAQTMKKHLNEYARMRLMQDETVELQERSDALTDKIEIARKLPGVVLTEAKIPVQGLTVVNGIPLVHGLPLSNLSDGEKLDLCVDIAVLNPKGLQIILIDGTERLDDKSRQLLYEKCKAKGLQFIATRTDNSDELIITEME